MKKFVMGTVAALTMAMGSTAYAQDAVALPSRSAT